MCRFVLCAIALVFLINISVRGAYAESKVYDLANQHYNSGNYAKAKPLFNKSLETESLSDSQKGELYFKLGRISHYANNPTAAIESFQMVGDSYPQTPHAAISRKWLGDCYLLQDNFDTALSIYSSVLTDFSDSHIIQAAEFEIARTLFRKGDYDESLSEFSSFVTLYPDHLRTLHAKFYIERNKRMLRRRK